MNTKTKTLIALAVLSLADMVIPIPILGIILLYVVIQKPTWFTQLSREIYGT